MALQTHKGDRDAFLKRISAEAAERTFVRRRSTYPAADSKIVVNNNFTCSREITVNVSIPLVGPMVAVLTCISTMDRKTTYH